MQQNKGYSTGVWCAIRLQLVDIVDIVDGYVKIELIVNRDGQVKIKRQLNVNIELEVKI
jgi:hypothetical protein